MVQLSRRTSRFDSERLHKNTFFSRILGSSDPEREDDNTPQVSSVQQAKSRTRRENTLEVSCSQIPISFSSAVFFASVQETLAKFKRLLSLARRSIEENQRQITEKDGQIAALREALGAAENARRR